MNRSIAESIDEHVRLVETVRRDLCGEIELVAEHLIACARRGNTIFWCGNGGSASDSQHLAAELVGRFKRERRAIASVALTANSSTVTSVGNDYGFDQIFSRQVEALVRNQDVLVGLSTSGNSENVSAAVRAAKRRGALTIGMLGRDGGKIQSECDVSIVVPAQDTARIQEMHIMIGHIACDIVEQTFMQESG